jgi:hypothetical protein
MFIALQYKNQNSPHSINSDFSSIAVVDPDFPTLLNVVNRDFAFRQYKVSRIQACSHSSEMNIS